jgi:uncharacterized protein YndB with AHSA1/START domain
MTDEQGQQTQQVQQEDGQLNVEQSDNKITLSRVYDAPQELVFSMFKNPEHLAKWWGPTTWPASIKSFDFRPGGIWHYYMTGPDGEKAWGKATFAEIDEPNSITFTDAFSDEEGNVDPKLPVGKSTVLFAEVGGKTTLTMIGEYQSAEEVQKIVEMGMVEGMRDTWSQLERLLAEAQRAEK